MRADLHVHSTASDGVLTPTQLVSRALERGLTILALADHDSVEGVAEAQQSATGSSLRIIPAVEFSASVNERSIHILGYFVDPQDKALLLLLARLRESRTRRARAIVEALQTAGFEVSLANVLQISHGGAVGRTHIARALVNSGSASSVADAFERLVGRGMPFYRPKEPTAPAVCFRAILSAGGIPVLAHPGVTRADDLITGLISGGLLGIEAYHVEHSPAQRKRYAALAAERGLLVTGGSDFHSPIAHRRDLGSARVPAVAVDALIAAGERRASASRANSHS